ncbi:SPASM domain-containing protein [Ruminiclostridium cellulolyticum]|uniref:Radical SAM domain protein n=1 Tax=Ruminiclostridium cellulolyticum (strain ATCC 35319 / DSM 5812 / JCM 6584 / H10) TaxID=394503 RepID=B8I5F1_RUMCH|nr:SPASM domain-containing protein [Ruminiclostridium cellulolyticum]ACL76687.1 Radical SAM domain protein [Ruminiclostridium cellulolyticum H10]
MINLPAGFSSEEQYQFPNIINVCIFKGECSANCVHCPIGITAISERKEKFGSGSMTLEVFKKIADEVAAYPHCTLRIHSVGEPLMWENLTAAVKYAHSKGIITWIFTNAVTTDKKLLETVVSECSVVEVSVNSVDSLDYIETKGVDAFELVKENVEYMHKYIKENHLNTRFLLSRVESDDKEYDQKFLSYWKQTGYADDIFVRSYHSYNSLIEDKIKDNKVVACHVHWGRFNVDTNGEVVVCFNELFKGPEMDRTLVLGDLKKQSIQEIWHGEKLAKIRTSQIENKPELVDFTNNLPCGNCTYCQPLFSDSVKSENQINYILNSRNK